MIRFDASAGITVDTYAGTVTAATLRIGKALRGLHTAHEIGKCLGRFDTVELAVSEVALAGSSTTRRWRLALPAGFAPDWGLRRVGSILVFGAINGTEPTIRMIVHVALPNERKGQATVGAYSPTPGVTLTGAATPAPGQPGGPTPTCP